MTEQTTKRLSLEEFLQEWCLDYLDEAVDYKWAAKQLVHIFNEYSQDAALMKAERDRVFDL